MLAHERPGSLVCNRSTLPLRRASLFASAHYPKGMGEYTDKIAGKANQIKGVLTDDEATQAKGEAQEAKGRLKGAFERFKVRIKDAMERKQR